MGVKRKKGDFFSKRRSIKESFYPKFLVKKFLQWPLKQGKKFITIKKLLGFNEKLTYISKSCRRLDLLFIVLIYTSLFKFRSTNLTFIQRRLSKTTKKKVYGDVPYNHLEKNSIKQFSSVFNRELLKKNYAFFFLIQKYLKKRLIRNYRKKCYLSLMSISQKKSKP
jgi:hypothetical protein